MNEKKLIKRKKQIVFLESFPTIMVYKMAKRFKEKGYKTVSIRILESKSLLDDFYKNAFDKIISFNLSFFKINIKNFHLILFSLFKKLISLFKALFSILELKPYIIITRATPSWPCAATMILCKKTPIIYFPYDIRCQLSKQVLGKIKTPKFEIKAERYCFEHADGILHKGDPDELKFLNGRSLGNNIKLTPLQLNFLPYCSKEFIVPINKNKLSRKDKGIHIVNTDSMSGVGPSAATFLYDCIKLIIKQKIHLHTYSIPNSISEKTMLNFFKEDSPFVRTYKEVLNSKYFHLHLPLDAKKIIQEISKYDFGLCLAGPETGALKDAPELKFATGNKTASYLEAGIPILCEDKSVFTNKLIKKYKIGISFSQNNLKNIKLKLQKLDYKKLEKNILEAREDFDMEKNFPRLEKFIEKVVIKNNRF